MTTFNDREKAQEAKYVHDQETAFKIAARRNKLLGLWVAELMDLSGGAADAYAREVVASDLDEPGDEDVFKKVWGDLQVKNINLSEHRLRRKMEELLELARDQVTSE